MMGKYKRSKNPSEIDSWLDTMGYYRKNVAYDETCLFRAVSEQVPSNFVVLFKFFYIDGCFFADVLFPNFSRKSS